MKTRKQYSYTTPKCWCCDGNAVKRNDDGLPCCLGCLNKKPNINCPICKSELTPKSGKFGEYFNCMFCKVNYSINKIKQIQKFK